MPHASLRAAPLVAALALAAPALHAAPFTLLIHESESELARRADPGPSGQAYWASYAEVGMAMQSAGILLGGAALEPALTAPPAAATPRLAIGGYFIIEVPDAAAARAWAARIPAAATGAVEVRPHVAMPAMR
jgi:hypothetical protein